MSCEENCHSCNLRWQPQKEEHVKPTFSPSPALQHCFLLFSLWYSLARHRHTHRAIEVPKVGQLRNEECVKADKTGFKPTGLACRTAERLRQMSVLTDYRRNEWTNSEERVICRIANTTRCHFFAMLLGRKWIWEYAPDTGRSEMKDRRGNRENRCNNAGESDEQLDFKCSFS